MDASAEGIGMDEDADGDIGARSAASGLSDGRSGRSAHIRTSRVEPGDETSDICAGEGADEYALRRRSAGRGGGSGGGDAPSPYSHDTAEEHAASAAAPAAAAVGARGGDGGSGGSSGVPPLVGRGEDEEEDEDMSFYEENSRVQELEDSFADLPTPAPGGNNASGEAGAMGHDGRPILAQRSGSSEGWVDQYTNSSIGGSRDDLTGAPQHAHAAAAAADRARSTPTA
ncbi:unnamed protein product [Scytosiphon promiscuus]